MHRSLRQLTKNFGSLPCGTLRGKIYKPDTVFAYRAAVIGDPHSRLALILCHDGLNLHEVAVYDSLYRKRSVPPALFVGVEPGRMPAEYGERDMRMNDYDLFDREYGDFLISELIPHIAQKYDYDIDPNPDMHMVSGGSSGGISAFVIAYFHPDSFHRIYMNSPSFLSMGKGNEVPSLIRKTETKPFRIYLEYSQNEPDEYFGSSFVAALDIERALRFAGYTMKVKYNRHKGHCARYHDLRALRKTYEYLWADWQRPIVPQRNSPRIDRVVSHDTVWLGADDMPERAPETTPWGEYSTNGDSILLTTPEGSEQMVKSGFCSLQRVAVSSDMRRLYVADKTRPCIYAYYINGDGTLGGRYIHGMLHTLPDYRYAGATDICVDEYDRVYAATEIGIQCIRSFGLIDCILQLPQDAVPERLALRDHTLYAETSDGILMRNIIADGRHDTPTEPAFASYYT